MMHDGQTDKLTDWQSPHLWFLRVSLFAYTHLQMIKIKACFTYIYTNNISIFIKSKLLFEVFD